jgi:hypothetical protein
MFPAVAITWPHYARQFAEFRIKEYQHALQNAQAPYVQEKYPFDWQCIKQDMMVRHVMQIQTERSDKVWSDEGYNFRICIKCS